MLKGDKIKQIKKIKEAPVPELILGGLPLAEDQKEKPIIVNQGPIRLERIGGMFERVGTVPTHTPRNFKEQFVIFETGGSYKLYIYMKNAWRYINTTS